VESTHGSQRFSCRCCESRSLRYSGASSFHVARHCGWVAHTRTRVSPHRLDAGDFMNRKVDATLQFIKKVGSVDVVSFSLSRGLTYTPRLLPRVLSVTHSMMDFSCPSRRALQRSGPIRKRSSFSPAGPGVMCSVKTDRRSSSTPHGTTLRLAQSASIRSRSAFVCVGGAVVAVMVVVSELVACASTLMRSVLWQGGQGNSCSVARMCSHPRLHCTDWFLER